jgi:hypothetical protein
MSNAVEIYCMGIQKTKRGAKHGRVDRKVSYKVSDLGILVGEGQEESEHLASVRGNMFGFNRNGHQRIIFDPKTTSRLVVCPVSFGHPAATDKTLPFVVRFVSDAPLMIRELDNVPRMDSTIEQYCLSSTPSLTGQVVQKVIFEVKNSVRLVQVDCRANSGGTIFLCLCINEAVVSRSGISLSIEATCRGMSCRTSDGLIAHEIIAKGKKFEASWRKFTVDFWSETKSRLLFVLFQSGQDTEFGAIRCIQINSRSGFGKNSASTLDHFLGDKTNYIRNGIFNAPPGSQAFSRSTTMPDTETTLLPHNVIHDNFVEYPDNGDIALQKALQMSLLESTTTEKELLERTLAESRRIVSAEDNDLQRALAMSQKSVENLAVNPSARAGTGDRNSANAGISFDDSLLVDLTNDDRDEKRDERKPSSLEEKRRLAAQAALKRQVRRPLSPPLSLTIVLKLCVLLVCLSSASSQRISYELHKAVGIHEYHRRLSQTSGNSTEPFHWHSFFKKAQATRHLSRYEHAFRKSNNLDIMMNWDGAYVDEYITTEEPFQSLSQQQNASLPEYRRHLLTNSSQRIPNAKGSNMDAYQAVPLSQGYGTHLANIWVGSPHPQRKTVIVDTGSHFTAFPCTGCHDCGGSYHTDPYFDPSKSSECNSSEGIECIFIF